MTILLLGAGVFTLATLLLALLWRLGLAISGRQAAPRFWRRVLVVHLGLFVFHGFVTCPLFVGYLTASSVDTRADERAYAGPRIAADGTWALQSRESLAAEEEGTVVIEPEVRKAANALAVEIRASDGVKLRGFLVPPGDTASPPRFMAVLVHGWMRNALELEPVGSMLRDLGGEVLLLEVRSHGGSGRAKYTFGLDESLDVLAGAEFLRKRPGAERRPLIVFAVSLGTPAAALAARSIPGLAGLILDAPMDDLEATALRLLSKLSVYQPWASTILWSSQRLGGMPVDRVKPREQLAQLAPDVEVLLVGAGKDQRMPPDSVTALFEALPTPLEHKTLWIEPEAEHGKVWVVAPDEYRRRLARLCDSVAGRDAATAQQEP